MKLMNLSHQNMFNCSCLCIWFYLFLYLLIGLKTQDCLCISSSLYKVEIMFQRFNNVVSAAVGSTVMCQQRIEHISLGVPLLRLVALAVLFSVLTDLGLLVKKCGIQLLRKVFMPSRSFPHQSVLNHCIEC